MLGSSEKSVRISCCSEVLGGDASNLHGGGVGQGKGVKDRMPSEESVRISCCSECTGRGC